jgi:hypothetical protein
VVFGHIKTIQEQYGVNRVSDDNRTRLAGAVPVIQKCSKVRKTVPELLAVRSQEGRGSVLWLSFALRVARRFKVNRWVAVPEVEEKPPKAPISVALTLVVGLNGRKLN